MKLLVVRLSSLGDVVHALPLAANARAAGAEVGWLVETAYREILETNPDVGRVFLADTKAWRRQPVAARTLSEIGKIRRELSRFAPDITLDAQGLWKSAWLARSAGAPVVGFAGPERKEPASAILCDRPVHPRPGHGHVVDRNLSLLEAAGFPVFRRSPDARFLLRGASPEADAFLAGTAGPFALYHPGAGRPDKIFGEERLAGVARILAAESGLTPVVSWGPGDEERARAMAGLLPEARLPPLLSLSGLAKVIRAASLFVAGDTGPLHLADALEVPTLALFGPTDPRRNGPYRSLESAVAFDSSTRPEEVARRAREVLAV